MFGLIFVSNKYYPSKWILIEILIFLKNILNNIIIYTNKNVLVELQLTAYIIQAVLNIECTKILVQLPNMNCPLEFIVHEN